MAVRAGSYENIEATLEDIRQSVVSLRSSPEVWDLPRRQMLRAISEDLIGVIATVQSFDRRSIDPQAAIDRDNLT